jgi:hypothetical protein
MSGAVSFPHGDVAPAQTSAHGPFPTALVDRAAAINKKGCNWLVLAVDVQRCVLKPSAWVYFPIPVSGQ